MSKKKGPQDHGKVILNTFLCFKLLNETFLCIDYYEYLINLEEGGIEIHRMVNVQSLNDVVDAERGLDVARAELISMLESANISQKSIYKQTIYELRNNTTVFVSGAAGTGKSYVLRMLERHYKLKGFKVSHTKYLFKKRMLNFF